MVVNDRGGAASVAPLSVVKSDNRATLTGQVLVCFHGSCSVSAISPLDLQTLHAVFDRRWL